MQLCFVRPIHMAALTMPQREHCFCVEPDFLLQLGNTVSLRCAESHWGFWNYLHVKYIYAYVLLKMLYLVTCYHVYASLFRSFAVSHTTHWTNHSCILRVFHHSSYICCGSRLQYILLSCTSQANKQSLTVTHWTHQFVKCVMVRKVAFHV